MKLSRCCLVGHLGFEVFAVEASDVGDAFILGAYGLTSAGVGAVTETQLVHLGHHCLGALSGFELALWQEGELTHLRRHEEHRRAVLTSGHASSATDTSGAVHCFVCIGLGDEDGIGILRSASAHSYITASCLDSVESCTIDHAVLDYRESGRTPRLYGNYIAVLEATHIELASSCTALGLSVGCTVDVE